MEDKEREAWRLPEDLEALRCTRGKARLLCVVWCLRAPLEGVTIVVAAVSRDWVVPIAIAGTGKPPNGLVFSDRGVLAGLTARDYRRQISMWYGAEIKIVMKKR